MALIQLLSTRLHNYLYFLTKTKKKIRKQKLCDIVCTKHHPKSLQRGQVIPLPTRSQVQNKMKKDLG